jgi:hypothetical protein
MWISPKCKGGNKSIHAEVTGRIQETGLRDRGWSRDRRKIIQTRAVELAVATSDWCSILPEHSLEFFVFHH